MINKAKNSEIVEVEFEVISRRSKKPIRIRIPMYNDEEVISMIKDPNCKEEWVIELKNSYLDEYYSNYKETRRHSSLDDFAYEDIDYFDNHEDPAEIIENIETYKDLSSELSEIEKRRLWLIKYGGYSFVELSKIEEVSDRAVSKSVNNAIEKMKKKKKDFY